MVKKSTKKTSVKRRVSARPLSFWQFIRKNFLIISGLLLLPVTVGAVVSSYNYANQGSAAGRRNVLRTQDVPFACPTPHKSGGPCRSLTESGVCVAVGSCVSTTTRNWCQCLGYQSGGGNDYRCGLGPGCQAESGVPTVASPVCTSRRYEPVSCDNCLVQCVLSDGREITEKTVDKNDIGCYSAISSKCHNPSPVPQNPTSPPEPTPPPSGGTSGCQTVQTDQGPGCWCKEGWQYHYCTNWGKPDKYCNDQGCPRGSVGGQSTAGFDLQKALQNFFGIFGF